MILDARIVDRMPKQEIYGGELSATKKLRIWADSFRFAVTGNQFGKQRAAGTSLYVGDPPLPRRIIPSLRH
jgi:hypothetical protein